jgi:hypothetical protein
MRAAAEEASGHDGAASGAGAGPSVAFTVTLVQTALGYLLGGFGGCLLFLARDLAVPRETVSWVSEGFGASLLLLGLGGERLLGLGALRVLRLSAAALASGAALLGLAPTALPAQLGAVLLGAGGAGIVLSSPALLTGPAAASRLARAVAASSLAGIAAPALLGQVDALTGRGRLALLLAVPVLGWALARRGPPAHPASPEHTSGAAPEVPGPLVPWRVALRWFLIVSVVAPEFAFVVWGAARLQDSGLSTGLAVGAATAFPVGMGLGRLVGSHIFRSRWRLAGCVLLAIASALCAAAPVGPAVLTAAMLAAGLGLAPLYPFTLARLTRAPGLPLGRAAAFASAASGTAVLASPRLLALLAQHVPLRWGYLAVTPLLLAALWVALRGGPGAPAPRA